MGQYIATGPRPGARARGTQRECRAADRAQRHGHGRGVIVGEGSPGAPVERAAGGNFLRQGQAVALVDARVHIGYVMTYLPAGPAAGPAGGFQARATGLAGGCSKLGRQGGQLVSVVRRLGSGQGLRGQLRPPDGVVQVRSGQVGSTPQRVNVEQASKAAGQLRLRPRGSTWALALFVHDFMLVTSPVKAEE